jgi:tetratricopeptide (TPR) repeat protein
LPLFEKLITVYPADKNVAEALGILVFTSGIRLDDAAARKQTRVRARTLLLRAQELGADGALLTTILDEVPPDGGESVFSSRKDIDDIMRRGEEAFAKADYPKAIAAYETALSLDSNLYEAALFIGDGYYKSSEPDKAGQWYARAISIDPNRATAYRYWGDLLLAQGKRAEARDKFIEAYITEPHNRLASARFVQFANQNFINLAHPRIDIPTSVSTGKKGEINVNIDAGSLTKDDGSAAWIVYGLARGSWMCNEAGSSAKFAEHYPNEKTYRHSLAEEVDALRLVVSSAKEQKSKHLDPSLANLVKLNDAGLLEAYVLLARPDKGISHDYPAYLKSDRDKLRRYVVEYVMTGGGR